MKEYDVKRLCEDYGKGSIIGGILFLGAIVVDILYPGVGVTAFSIIYLILVINYFIHMQANGEKRYKNRQGL
ncbi:hypothetical protein lbkm_0842 [Lachnospiraceae bacterium KM106-2]|nr:hypothetical protein lbkm_0842 [Lachnospiraceae bacterium KM106-2]